MHVFVCRAGARTLTRRNVQRSAPVVSWQINRSIRSKQGSDNARVPHLRGKVERRVFEAAGACVYIGALADQYLGHADAPPVRRQVERSDAMRTDCVHRCIVSQQQIDYISEPLISSRVEWSHAGWCLRVRICPIAQQLCHRLVLVVSRSDVERAHLHGHLALCELAFRQFLRLQLLLNMVLHLLGELLGESLNSLVDACKLSLVQLGSHLVVVSLEIVHALVVHAEVSGAETGHEDDQKCYAGPHVCESWAE